MKESQESPKVGKVRKAAAVVASPSPLERLGEAGEAKPWRDMYFFFKEQFDSEYVLLDRKITTSELIGTQADVEAWLFEQYGRRHNVYEIDLLLDKYFEYLGEAGYLIKKENYHRLLHEIHNPDLPADMLPPDYIKTT